METRRFWAKIKVERWKGDAHWNKLEQARSEFERSHYISKLKHLIRGKCSKTTDERAEGSNRSKWNEFWNICRIVNLVALIYSYLISYR
jgi:hypothetical protein